MRAVPTRGGGFTLIEVLVSMIVIAIGLLGIAKMQSIALSSTGVASLRSVASLQASSLAAAMHADRGYWAAGLAPATVTITGTTITTSAGANPVTTVADCTVAGADAPCTPTKVAAYDLQQWATDVNNLLPGPITTISCSQTVNQPVSCTLQIVWGENSSTINKLGTAATATASANATAATSTFNVPTYTLYVQP